MAALRFVGVQSHPTEFLDLTILTLAEFQQLVPSFEAALQAHMAAWRLDGKPRTVRVKDRLRLWKQGIRDLVMEICCALHNFRVRLTPWQPVI
jgi:hypothetical protein